MFQINNQKLIKTKMLAKGIKLAQAAKNSVLRQSVLSAQNRGYQRLAIVGQRKIVSRKTKSTF